MTDQEGRSVQGQAEREKQRNRPHSPAHAAPLHPPPGSLRVPLCRACKRYGDLCIGGLAIAARLKPVSRAATPVRREDRGTA
jgi:hypothetical protein